jgi:hypothetical protein
MPIRIEVHDGPSFEIDNCEYKTEGKPAKLLFTSSKSPDQLPSNKQQQQTKTPTNVFKLSFRNEDLRCLAIISENSILLVNKLNEFYLINNDSDIKDSSNFRHVKLSLKKQLVENNGNMVVDVAYEAKTGSIYVLNRFNIEIYRLLANESKLELVNELVFIKNSSNLVSLPQSTSPELQIAGKPSPYSRIFMSYDDDSTFVLVDRLNNRIYWYFKKTYQKKRCVKAVNGSIIEPYGFLSTKSSIYVISKAGLLICNQESTILHSTLNNIIDIVYDFDNDFIYFIDLTSLYFINLTEIENETGKNQIVFKKYRKIISINKFNDKEKYKEFKRIVINKKFVYLLIINKTGDGSSIFAIERKIK